MEKTTALAVNTGIAVPKYSTKESLLSTGSGAFFTSIDNTTEAGKKLLFNALMSPDAEVNDIIGKSIVLKDVIVQSVEVPVTDDKGEEVLDVNGETQHEVAPQIILIDENGKSYTSVSKGMRNSVASLIQAYGEPQTWEAPMKIEILQRKVRRGSMMIINVL